MKRDNKIAIAAGAAGLGLLGFAALLPKSSAVTPPPTNYSTFGVTSSWNLWATPTFISVNSQYLTQDVIDWPESYTAQIATDFGYTIFPLIPGNSEDGVHMDLVLNPSYSGGASTGTVYGGDGMSMDPTFVLPSTAYNGIQQFWYFLLSLHETVNVWTGNLAQGWPWADGSNLWNGTSPFPNMCDIVISGELGLSQISSTQSQRMAGDSGVQLFLNIQQTYGWQAYKTLFSLTQQYGITDWHVYSEPLRTAVICLFLSSGAQTNLLPQFQSVVNVTNAAFAQAQALYPSVTF